MGIAFGNDIAIHRNFLCVFFLGGGKGERNHYDVLITNISDIATRLSVSPPIVISRYFMFRPSTVLQTTRRD